MSYHLAPSVSSVVSLIAILSSPNTPFWLSVLLISLKKITGSGNGPAEYHPAPALHADLPLQVVPVTATSVNA